MKKWNPLHCRILLIGIILKSGKLKTFKIECVIGITDDDKHGCSLIADHIQFHFVIRHAFSKLLNIKWWKSGTTGKQNRFCSFASNKMSIVFNHFFKKGKKTERIVNFHTLYLTFHIKFLNSTNLNWDFMYSKGFNNCYILLSNISQAFENTKFGAGELSLIVSLVLYRPTSVYELW